tara:strand:+ start:6217 stop:7488 length:1272 start_codon:yes stop_codon:yes gene_type:complete
VSNETSTQSAPLSRDQLVRFITDSYKPSKDWKIGFEYEVSGVLPETLKPIQYTGERSVKHIIDWFRNKYGDNKLVWEDGYCYGLDIPYGRITLEPGGQIEFSSYVAAELSEMREQLTSYLTDICTAGAEKDIIFYTAGVEPFHPREERPWSGKARYKVMREYLIKQGKLAHHMMQQTMSIQYNIDFSDKQDALDKYHAAIAIYPTFQFITTNSRIYAGEVVDTPFRRTIWEHTDPDRSGLPPKLESLEDYVEYGLDTPMFLINRGESIPMKTRFTFRQFMEEGYEGHQATYEDWEFHMSTLFPEVRFKKNALELRMFDGNPASMMEAMAAVVKGIWYNEEQLKRALTLDWGEDWDSVKQLYTLASAGLQEDEQLYLHPLTQMLEKKQNPGEHAVEVYEASGNDLNVLLQHLRLCPNKFESRTA